MAIQRLKPSFQFDSVRIDQLKQIAPEAFADGKINWETLQEALGEYIEEGEINTEHFGLFWPGKRTARKLASIPSEGTLIPCKGQGLNEECSPNIIIEGENLEVLKLLQKSYSDKIKMVYIDPPYNTGKDFIYDDNFIESIDEYLKRTGQLDEEAKPVSANTKADGRFHSKWLSMIYPRLRLAKNLLDKEKGVLFVSIDDNEVFNLRCILNEVFGEENFLAQLIWNQKSGSQAGHFTKSHEYIICFASSKDSLNYFKDKFGGAIKHGALKKISRANPPSPITFPKGFEFEGSDAVFSGEIGGSEKQIIDGKMIFKNGKLEKEVTITAGWAMKNQVLSWIDGKKTFDSKGQRVTRFYFNNKGLLWYEKERGTIHPKTVLPETLGNTQTGTTEVEGLLKGKYFDFPKPSSLIEYLIQNSIDSDDDIVLDFFAGSGSTGHAVQNLIEKDIIKPKYILVQLPEVLTGDTDTSKAAMKAGYNSVSEITIQRIKNVCKLYKSKIPEEYAGFKIYKLAKSNFKVWKNVITSDIKKLELEYEKFEDSLVENWQKEDLLTEITLIEGFPLDSIIEELKEYNKNAVVKVSSTSCEHKLLVCLDSKVYADTIKSLQFNEDDIFICLDSAISDQDKVTLQDKGLIKTI